MLKTKQITACMMVLVALACVSGCNKPDEEVPYAPEGGVDADNGHIFADDVWLDAPNGVAAGGKAALRLTLTNETSQGDALVAVTSPDATRANFQIAGKPAKTISIAAGEATNLEWRRGSGVELEDFRREIQAGVTWFPVTLTFEKSSPITMSITSGPLGAPADGN